MLAHSSSTRSSGGSSGFPVSRRAVVGVGDDLLYESGEQRLEAALLVSRRAEVGGVPAAVKEPVGAEFGRHRRREHTGVDVGVQHRLGGRVDAASRSVVPERYRLEGVERLLLVVLFERSLDAAGLLRVDPGDDLRHRAAATSGCEQDRREQLGRGSVPEVGSLARRGARSGAPDEPFRDALRSLPGEAFDQRRPADARKTGAACRVVDERARASDGGARGDRLAEEVGLDGRRDDRSVPLEDRRDREPCRLARLSGADDDRGLSRLGGDELAGVSPEDQAAGPVLPDAKKTQVRRARPSRRPLYDVSVAQPPRRSAATTTMTGTSSAPKVP